MNSFSQRNPDGSSVELLLPKWLEQNWGKLPEWYKKVASDAVVESGKVLLKEARLNLTPAGGLGLRTRSGRFMKSLKLTQNKRGQFVTGMSLSFPRIPGTVLNDGALIRPRKGKYLTFRLMKDTDTTVATGQFVRVKQVLIRPTHWADKAQAKAVASLMPAVRRAVERSLL